MENKIRWQRGDAIKLGKAVADFNRKINRLQSEESKLYLPETLNYKQIKENITTRKELNRQVTSLKRFMKEGAEDIYTTKAGEQLTKWEKAELQKQSNIAKRRLRQDITKLETPKARRKIFTCSNGI